jgi:hypothetical protein
MGVILNNPYFLILAILVLANLVFSGFFFWQFRTYRQRQTALLQGEEIPDLEAIVLKQKKTLAVHDKNLRELGKLLVELVDNNKFNLQKIGVVRFNPFADTGSNMSFAMALLDGQNNGIVISSLHSREGTRVYGKPIQDGQSSFVLNEEEKQAIQKAGTK